MSPATSTTTPSEAPWVSISHRKQADRLALIPKKWRLRAPPPADSSGPKSVLHIPLDGRILSPNELAITELYTASTLVQALSERKLTCLASTTAFCKRAAIAQQVTNCLTEPLFESALQRAKELDAEIAKTGKPVGPLHGLPISVKDSFHVPGVDSSLGLAALCYKPAQQTSVLVELLLSLGCVIVAKTNVPQTLASLDSVNNVFGRTMNPVNRKCTAGGSSGGEGVMVAMKGCMVGWGTDIGGSIRVPAMCNGVYGFKPSHGRVPYGKQSRWEGYIGYSRLGLGAVAGPLARSVEDIEFVMREVVPRSELWGQDCVPGVWGDEVVEGSGKGGKFVFGVLVSDGNCEPLRPIQKLIGEVAEKLRKVSGVEVVELETPKAWKECQSLLSKFLQVDPSDDMVDMIEEMGEPLVPWMVGKFGRSKGKTTKEVAELQKRRCALEAQMLEVWNSREDGGRRKIDAFICPVAPHPVPEIDRWNAVGYTSSFNLLDYPAGVVPVRDFTKNDLELGKAQGGKSLGSWDDRNRELWDENKTDRKVYLGTPLCVQVVTPRLHDRRLGHAMAIVDRAVHQQAPSAKL